MKTATRLRYKVVITTTKEVYDTQTFPQRAAPRDWCHENLTPPEEPIDEYEKGSIKWCINRRYNWAAKIVEYSSRRLDVVYRFRYKKDAVLFALCWSQKYVPLDF